MDRWLEEKIGKDLAAKYAAQTILLSDVHICFDDPGYLERFSNDNDDDRVISTRMARQTVTLVVLEKGALQAVQENNDERTLYGKTVVTDNLHLVRHIWESGSSRRMAGISSSQVLPAFAVG
jgi:hypothetical protein